MDIEEKQNFLQSEILAQDYDAELFTEFFNFKTDYEELPSIALTEVKEIVAEFKSKFSPGQTLDDVRRAKEEEERLAEEQERTERERKEREQMEEERRQREETQRLEREKAERERIAREVRERDMRERKETMEREAREREAERQRELDQQREIEERLARERVAEEIQQEEAKTEVQAAVKTEERIAQDKPTDQRTSVDHGNSILYEIECVLSEDTELSQAPDILIEVSLAETVEGGVFSSYQVHTLKTSPLNWQAKRKFEDFKWLREKLAAQFPGVCLPPLPPKTSRDRSYDDSAVKRQRFLTRFVNALVRIPVILRSSIFEVFLKEENMKHFGLFKKQLKTSKPDKVSDTFSLTGKQECNLEDNPHVFRNIVEYANESENLKKKLKRMSQTIINNLASLGKSLESYSDLFKDLERAQNLIPNNEANESLYLNMYNATKYWANYQKERLTNMNEFLTMYFKYSYFDSEAHKEFLKQRESAGNNLKRHGNAANRDMFGFINAQTISETQRISEDGLQQGTQHFALLAKKEAEQSSQLQAMWGNLKERIKNDSN